MKNQDAESHTGRVPSIYMHMEHSNVVSKVGKQCTSQRERERGKEEERDSVCARERDEKWG